MAFDGLVTKSVVDECKKTIEGGRISKIYQPTETDIILQIRAGGENRRLLISASLTFPRVHLSDETFSNPTEPPMFCMLLRKHCEGAIIDRISQVGMERVIHLDMKVRDELGDWKTRRIIVEIMGRHSNIILLDVERNLILDGIHHVTPAMSTHRVVLPGRPYVAPPEQGKKNPLLCNKEQFIQSFDYNAGKLDKQIVDRFSGVSPLIAKEIVHRSPLGDRDKLWESFQNLMTDVRDGLYTPQIVTKGDKAYFSITDLTHLDGAKKEFETIHSCLQTFFERRAERDAVRQKAHDLIRFVSNERDKNEKKILKLEETRKEAQEADQLKLYGELITAYMHELKKGEHVARVVNYYDEEGSMIDIPLDPLKTPAENAQSYYRKYNKARNSLHVIEEQIELAEKELEYFDGLVQQLSYATLEDIAEIREELVEEGYLRFRGKKGKKKPEKPHLEKYLSTDGIEILVGKNNKQNEYLTNRLAHPMETWLHTKDIPGSHVVIRSKEPTENTLKEAASLAAYFSKARGSNQIPVDYTLIKHVRKPSGSKPGYVIYEQQKTIYVSSDEELVRTLRQKN
ncbi:NFACT family protein [Ammoniphilus sp. CFH 90114]|uniref:Rqc2 family fibronectin-binding protein n=1 Tax=Ammoniphilus sp. CFH 90114 TaxID=2493665 RepID=UPI00100DD1A9|nr:NFACT RNA binding domain-containing protein [Ammoniphilus sp. CFH 90114]RXT15039.1 fibronectin/fibrinogen-binding protein [Ammoniphilus sp. CFH 90114]